MADEAHLHLEIRGPVARVTLQRPDIHNAFDDRLVTELRRTAAELAAAAGVRVVVLAGAGKSFCAGADLNWMKRMVDYTAKENRDDSLAMARMFEAWNDLPKPVVGRVHGAAIGGGVGLVSVCDVVVAADDASFAFSEARLGILPAVISPFVLQKISPGAARALFLTAERFDARRARELGLVHRVVAAAELDAEVGRVVDLLLAAGPRAQVEIKRLLPEVVGRTPAEARPATAESIGRARTSSEGQEGMRSFLERRPAPWKKGH